MNETTDSDIYSSPAIYGDTDNTLLLKLCWQLRYGTTAISGGAGSIAIPPYDYVSYTYYGSTNNIQTAVFKSGGSGGATVATLTYTYVGSGAADNDKVASITKS